MQYELSNPHSVRTLDMDSYRNFYIDLFTIHISWLLGQQIKWAPHVIAGFKITIKKDRFSAYIDCLNMNEQIFSSVWLWLRHSYQVRTIIFVLFSHFFIVWHRVLWTITYDQLHRTSAIITTYTLHTYPIQPHTLVALNDHFSYSVSVLRSMEWWLLVICFVLFAVVLTMLLYNSLGTSDGCSLFNWPSNNNH